MKTLKQVQYEIMWMNRGCNDQLLRRMGALKAKSESQVQTRTTLGRVQGAYAKRFSPYRWEACTW
ncbi:MAG: hypothetical protein VX598_02295 [Verrucomicrobiota bacterium]|nr:hypothetical protein [Verrucomicrobiota bacterium]